ncbi:heavy metal-associated isoprenylated plant protein 39-like [Primulina huaijiensis]|uniref:heavy metal-associated isoprenylated plant protein 39-like n=1 Tax=Primulina huaijiensis TaxID=1492673 RepID=UPI003CC75AC9
MKKFVLNLDLADADDKRRALKTVSTLAGIDEICIDIKGKKLTVIGTVDPVTVVSKLRKKNWPANLISVGPAKEPEKKPEEPTKEEAKKEETKEEAKKDEPKKEESKDEAKKDEPKKEGEKKAEPAVLGTIMPMPYRPYYPTMNTYYYMQQHRSIEENPDACIVL